MYRSKLRRSASARASLASLGALLLGTSIVGATALGACVVMPGDGDADGSAPDGGADASPDVVDSGAVPAPGDPPPPASLKTVPIPEPENLADFVRDRDAAIILGKALFWDMQIGSDGVQACASCHFHAGADNRSRNQLSPGVSRPEVGAPANRDKTFQIGGAPNYQLTPADFPFHRKVDPTNRDSPASFDANDVVSSQGVPLTEFVAVVPGRAVDEQRSVPDPDGFRIGDLNVRRVEARNTPTVINAVFNFRNFWDGRAQNEFNGVNSLGAKDPNASIFKVDGAGEVVPAKVLLRSSSLASQAMEPPISNLEMSADGRSLVDIGRKFSEPSQAGHPGALGLSKVRRLAALRPLGRQVVHPDDSVLGAKSRSPLRGIKDRSYAELVEKAFLPQWWKSKDLIEVDAAGTARVLSSKGRGASESATPSPGCNVYTLLEYNFSLFFGLAVQMYQATLVADDTPFDRFRDGDPNAMTPLERRGLDLFLSQSRGRCINCHGGPELTDASVTRLSRNRLRRREGTDILDFGFNNIGVRPTFEDLGIGGRHPLDGNVILSEARLAFLGQFTDPTLSPPIGPTDRLAVDGAFKVPGLRNVALTAPYFHNGGTLTLEQVVDFYSRGGDFHPIETTDGGEIAPLTVLNTTVDEKAAFVAFLRSLTDERVRREQAPFDHPQLFVPNGHVGNTTSVTDGGNGAARDTLLEIRAVGRRGGPPLRGFLE